MMRAGLALAFAFAVLAHVRPAAARCHEPEDVVLGYDFPCGGSPFGYEWAAHNGPDLAVEAFPFLGLVFERYTPRPFVLSSPSMRVAERSPANITGYGVSSVTFMIGWHFLYAGVALNPMFFSPPPVAGFAASRSDGSLLEPLAVLGARVFLSRYVAVSAELAGGARFASFDYCQRGAQTSCVSFDQDDAVLFARVRASVFVLRDRRGDALAINVMFGQNALATSDITGGIALSFELR